MEQTIYTQFQQMVLEHRQETAVIENNRTLTFAELSDLLDTIAPAFP